MNYYTISGLARTSDLQLSSTGDLITGKITATPTIFGLTTSSATEMAAAYGAYDTALQDLIAADNAYRAAVQAKITAREQLLAKFDTYLPMCYANPAVSNDELAMLSLAPRAERENSIPVFTPLDLLATPVVNNASVLLKWKRNGNSGATTFNVEKKIEDGAWDLVWSGPRSKVELEDCPAGVETRFRVFASKGDLKSNYSNVITIFDDGVTLTLSTAA